MRLALLMALLAGAAFLLRLDWRGLPADVVDDAGADDAAPRYQVSDARILQFDGNGQLRYEAQAMSVRFFDDDSLQLDALQLSQLGGREVWTLSAPSAYGPPGERRILMQGPVRGDGQWPSGERFELRSDHLWVDTLRREIYTDSDVSLIGRKRQLQAQGLRADWNGTRLNLMRDVKARYSADG